MSTRAVRGVPQSAWGREHRARQPEAVRRHHQKDRRRLRSMATAVVGAGLAVVLILGVVAGDAANPEELFRRTPEAAVVNPDNPFVLVPQVACAAHEVPLDPSDEEWFGPGLDDAVRDLVLDEQLKPRDGRMYWAGREPPSLRVGLRTGSSAEFELLGRDDDGDERDDDQEPHCAAPFDTGEPWAATPRR